MDNIIQVPPLKVNYFKKYWWILLILFFILLSISFFIVLNSEIFKGNKKVDVYDSSLPDCPSDLSGLLTYPIIDPTLIVSLAPLGNSNPPGHTFPVDHIYFNLDQGENNKPTSVYSPGDGILTSINKEQGFNDKGEVMRSGVNFHVSLCKGVYIIIASSGKLTPEFENIIKTQSKEECKKSPGKHLNEKSLKQCNYQLKLPIKAGKKIYDTIDDYPEVWATNFNQTPDPSVDWKRYNSDLFTYSICLFDLYKGELKDTFYSKFGTFSPINMSEDPKKKQESKPIFTPRTIEPICGTPHQNVAGTLQGDWFATNAGGEDSPEFTGNGLALIHDNFDPTYGKMVIGGNFTNSGVIIFMPKHEGNIDREFSEIKPSKQIYCYDSGKESKQGESSGKVIIQLVDEHHLKVEHLNGVCTNDETFNSPYFYER